MSPPYRTSALSAHEARYRAAWADLRRRRRIRWIAWAVWAPVTFIVRYLLVRIVGAEVADEQMMLVAPGFMAIAFGFLFYPFLFRCPRCGERFERFGMWNSFSKPERDCCQSCKLDKDVVPTEL